MRSDNSIHLTTAAKRRHELTRAKAIAALHELDRAGDPITFESVADHAGVSRSWLYTQTDLKDEIRRLRARNQPAHATATPARQRATDDWLVFPHEVQGLTREEILQHKPLDESFFSAKLDSKKE